MEIAQQIVQGIIDTSLIEWTAVFIGFAYLFLIAKQNKWGWLFALGSSAIYTFLTFKVNLYFEAALQSFYFFMAIYGWYSWKKAQDKEEGFIIKWTPKKHTINIIASTIIAIVLGYLMQKYTDQESPYLDSLTTIFSLGATFLAAHRILGNWIYWIVIDTALIFLYAKHGYYLVGIQYIIYTIIAIFAYRTWNKSYKTQKN